MKEVCRFAYNYDQPLNLWKIYWVISAHCYAAKCSNIDG